MTTKNEDDETAATDLYDRAQAFVAPLCHRNQPVPLAHLRKRLDLLRTWALRRQAFMPSLQVLVGQVDDFVETLECLGGSAFSRDQLRRVLTDLGEPAYSQHPAQSGLVHVNHPGAILAPARAIVWWDFSRSTAPTPPRLLLSLAEQQAMRAAGLTPPDPALTMAAEAATWQRPFLAATEALYLVCPTFNETGEPNHPHPAWDEITARLKDPQYALRLQLRDMDGFMKARHTKVASRVLVQPVSRVQVPNVLSLREVESPSSLVRLLGCSLSWALHYAAHVRAGRACPPRDVNPRLYGLIAHDVLAGILRDERDPETASARAASTFDSHYTKHAEMLGLPHFQVEKAQLRAAIAASAKRLVALVSQLGATVAGTEIEKSMKVERRSVTGTPDLLLQDPDMVIDLKWGKTHYHGLLESGTHVQLATYAAMVKRDKVFPETAYFSLNDQCLLVEPNGRLAGEGRAPGTQCAPEVWQGTVRSLNRCVTELANGQLVAPVIAQDKVKPRLDGEGVHVAPRCEYCDFGVLCGIKAIT